MNQAIIDTLHNHGVKPTTNRILVLNELFNSDRPLSLNDLVERIDTLEKSSIFRTLTLLHRADVLHVIEDGRGIARYEPCSAHDHCSLDDMHVHFYCEQCGNVLCLDDIPIPHIDMPEGYQARSANFMIKGICPACRDKSRH